MKIKIITITLLILGLLIYSSGNYNYNPKIFFVLLCIYFLFVIIVTVHVSNNLNWILITITAVFAVITSIGLMSGNIRFANLTDHLTSYLIIFIIPYFLARFYCKHKQWKISFALLFLFCNLFTSYYYFYFIDNKTHFGTYFGNYRYNLKPNLILSNNSGKAKKIVPGKTYVVDMWNKGCGVCLIKFPKVNSLKKKYEHNTDIEFLALNIYQSEDEIISSQERFNRANLDFPTYFLAQEKAAELKPEFFPITLVIKDNKIIFRGSVETLNALDFLYLN